MKKFTFMLVSVIILAGISAPAQASQGVAKKYSSCAKLLGKYPNGVAKSKKARKRAVKGGFAKPKVSKAVYKRNGSRLDKDKNGVLCEQESKSLCAVKEQGFTPLSDLRGSGPGVSVGVVAENQKSVDAVQVELKVNAYGVSGELLDTQEFGLQNIPAKQSVVDGFSWNTRAAVGSIRVMLTCQEPAFEGSPDLPRFQRATATYSYGDYDPYSESPNVRGVFRNRQDTEYFFNVFYVLRNTQGAIVAGGFSNSLGTVPGGGEVAWESNLSLPESLGPLTVEANTSSVYNAF